MTQTEQLKEIWRKLDFLSGMLIAWDTDRVAVDDVGMEGIWYMVECIKKEVESLQ